MQAKENVVFGRLLPVKRAVAGPNEKLSQLKADGKVLGAFCIPQTFMFPSEMVRYRLVRIILLYYYTSPNFIILSA